MRIALISCTKSKTSYPAPARVLYSESDLFRKALAHVERYADQIYVLSAKYGLVPLDQDLEPYEQTLKTMSSRERSTWAKQVLVAIQARHGTDLSGITFEFHAGAEYSDDLIPLLTRSGALCARPLEGLKLGERKRFYLDHASVPTERKSPAPVAAAAMAAEPKRVMPGTQAGRAGFAEVWARIEAHAGQPFYQVRGGEFRYAVSGQTLRPDRTNQVLPYTQFEKAYGRVPLDSTAAVQDLRGPSYLYAILMDPRIRQSDW